MVGNCTLGFKTHAQERRAGLAGQLGCFQREATQTYTPFIPLHNELLLVLKETF